MNRFLESLRLLLAKTGKAIIVAYRATALWLSVPFNFVLALIGLCFLISFGSLALGERFESVVLFFPDAKGALRGETRAVPRGPGGEARADRIASELLLGPKSADLQAAFESGTRVQSVIYRKGRLFLDISPEAALSGSASLQRGIAAAERSLRAALPGMKRLSLTIGGKEPYAVGIGAEGGVSAVKKTGI
jgi:hypothetical protein